MGLSGIIGPAEGVPSAFDFRSRYPEVYISFAFFEQVVATDIKPGSDPNSINLKSKGKIPVAILTTGDFDAQLVDPSTVQFGPGAATESHNRWHVKDVDEDGDLDLLFHFNTQDTGIQCGDTEATLTGMTFSGEPFTGTDAIRIVKCR